MRRSNVMARMLRPESNPVKSASSRNQAQVKRGMG
jgi:hypothetical protein